MAIEDFARTDVLTMKARESAFAAAQAMASRNIGSVVVVNEANHPLAVVTDRDLATMVIAESRNPVNTALHEIMDRAVITVTEGTSFGEALKTMAERDVRRMPVVSADGTLRGIVSLNDLLRVIADEMSNVKQLIGSESAPLPISK